MEIKEQSSISLREEEGEGDKTDLGPHSAPGRLLQSCHHPLNRSDPVETEQWAERQRCYSNACVPLTQLYVPAEAILRP